MVTGRREAFQNNLFCLAIDQHRLRLQYVSTVCNTSIYIRISQIFLKTKLPELYHLLVEH